MFVRPAAIAACLLSSACVQAAPPAPPPQGVPVAEFLDRCEGKTGWTDPAPPLRVFANVYYVGTCGIASLLIVGNEGSVLIDGGPREAAPLIAANIRALGLKPGEVKWIVFTHEHSDHVGGVAELQRLTGAQIAARAPGREALESGRPTANDPQHDSDAGYPPARVARTLADGDTLTVGDLAITAHATPGHTPGSTTWSWRACEGDDCRQVVYADSLTPVSADSYRFSDHPEYLANFRHSLDTVAALPCDLLITPHPGASMFFERLAGDAPLADPQACRNYAASAGKGLDERLAKEKAGKS